MRRMKRQDQRGATAVVVALLLVVLTGFTALAVDVGALRWDQKQLQNGADAAALAIANDCAKDACGETQGTARSLSEANTMGTGSDMVTVELEANSVRVGVGATREHWFAPVLGTTSTDVSASATAAWGTPKSLGTIPITVSQCALERGLLDDPSKLLMLYTKSKDGNGSGNDENACDKTQGPHVIPGGFQWLKPDKGCNVVTNLDKEAASDPGNTNPKSCGADELNALLRSGGDVLIPVYSKVTGNGANGKYTLVSYAAMRITTYCLTNKIHSVKETPVSPSDIKKCNGSERWIEGWFVRHVSLEDAAELGGSTNHGVTVVRLTN